MFWTQHHDRSFFWLFAPTSSLDLSVFLSFFRLRLKFAAKECWHNMSSCRNVLKPGLQTWAKNREHVHAGRIWYSQKFAQILNYSSVAKFLLYWATFSILFELPNLARLLVLRSFHLYSRKNDRIFYRTRIQFEKVKTLVTGFVSTSKHSLRTIFPYIIPH